MGSFHSGSCSYFQAPQVPHQVTRDSVAVLRANDFAVRCGHSFIVLLLYSHEAVGQRVLCDLVNGSPLDTYLDYGFVRVTYVFLT